MAAKLLKAASLKNIQPKEKAFRLNDGDGLSLVVWPSGVKSWQYIYKIDGKSKTFTLGNFPDLLLSDARQLHQDARRLRALGEDPKAVADKKNRPNGGTTFKSVAGDWHAKWKQGVSEGHSVETWARLERWAFPSIGQLGIDSIETPDLVAMLNKIEKAGVLSTAHRVRIDVNMVFVFAVQSGLIKHAPSSMLKGVLSPERRRHYRSITDPERVADLVRGIEAYHGSPVTKAALWLAILTFQRPSQIRFARREQLDFKGLDGPTWLCNPDMMKGTLYEKEYGGTHLVPLSTQAVQIIKDLEELTGPTPQLFPGRARGDSVISSETVNKALRIMGFAKELTGHGFRAMARTVLAERLKVTEKFIEHQLDHKVKDPLGRAYDRTSWQDERREMMQLWSDYLFELSRTTDVDAVRQLAYTLRAGHDLR